MPKVKFCTIGLYDKEDNLLSIKFDTFFNRLESLMLEEVSTVVKSVEDDEIRIMKYYRKDDCSKDEFVIPIGKLKDGATYTLDDDKKKLIEVNQDLYNINLMYYNKNENLLLITVDKNGPTIKKISEYLQSFLSSDDVKIKIQRIYKNVDLEKAKKSNYISNVEITLDLSTAQEELYTVNSDQEESILSYISKIAKCTKDDTNSNKLVLSFGLGKYRKTTMTLNAVVNLLDKLDMNNEMIKEVSVRYRDNATENLQTAKLKASNFELTSDLVSDGAEYILQNSDDILSKYRFYFRQSILDLKEEAEEKGGYNICDYMAKNKGKSD